METEQKHTPGPCSIKEFACTQSLVIGPESNEPQLCVLASCEGADRLGNATLFAAAPDMLEACEFAKSQIKKQSPKKALPVLRAAIAKATH